MQTLAEIIDAILAGHADENLDDIIAAVKDRRSMKSRALFHTIRPGAKAKLKNLRPKYLIGVPVVIVKKNQTRIECKIDPGYLAANPGAAGRFDTAPFSVTPDMLDLDLAD
jgi:hypothetical protein